MIWTVLLAAGQGARLASATGGMPKQFLEWHGNPLYWESVRTFSRCARLGGIVFVFPENVLEAERERVSELMRKETSGLAWRVVPGGKLRQHSVCNGLDALPRDCSRVLVHDAARPFVSPLLVNRVLDALERQEDSGTSGGIIPGLPVTDTIKIVADGLVSMTPDRTALAAVQTPQGFDLRTLRAAHARARTEGWVVTDDASVLERAGFPVWLVEGEPENRKITSPEDLEMLQEKNIAEPCAGYGYDVHRYAQESASSQPARPMRLGGVHIPDSPEVLAHSDGDVLLHALMDALLGCIGGGDIGLLFPDADPAFDNMNSAVLLDDVLGRVREEGVRIVHADLTIIAQIPRIGPHREAIRRNVARLLGIEVSRVNVKATTEEGLGFTGEGLGIKAVAVVSALR